MGKYKAYCEIFRAKSSLFYSDDNYHMERLGFFITDDFSITFGTINSQSNGEVTAPKSFYINREIRVGDIVNVTLINYPRPWYTISSTSSSDYNHPFTRAFSVSNIDGLRLVLTDAVEYAFGNTTIGYVGNVYNEELTSVIEILTQRQFRAYALKHYNVNNRRIPINIDSSILSVTSFTDEFEKTNVNPYSVITKALRYSSILSMSSSERNQLISARRSIEEKQNEIKAIKSKTNTKQSRQQMREEEMRKAKEAQTSGKTYTPATKASTTTELTDEEKKRVENLETEIKTLKTQISQIQQNNRQIENVGIELASSVRHEDGGYYLYIWCTKFNWLQYDLVINPSANIQALQDFNTSAASFWIQPDVSYDDYVFAGILGLSKQRKLERLENLTTNDTASISKIPAVTIGFEELRNSLDDTNPLYYTAPPYSKGDISDIIDFVITSDKRNQSFDTVNLFKSSLRSDFNSVEFDVKLDDVTNLRHSLKAFTGEEQLTIYYNNPFNRSLNNQSARIIARRFDNSGITYKIKTIEKQ